MAEQNASGKGNLPQMPKEEEIGYHKGALNTLMNERNELIKIIQVVDSYIQGHMKRLQDLGVEIKQGQNQGK